MTANDHENCLDELGEDIFVGDNVDVNSTVDTVSDEEPQEPEITQDLELSVGYKKAEKSESSGAERSVACFAVLMYCLIVAVLL